MKEQNFFKISISFLWRWWLIIFSFSLILFGSCVFLTIAYNHFFPKPYGIYSVKEYLFYIGYSLIGFVAFSSALDGLLRKHLKSVESFYGYKKSDISNTYIISAKPFAKIYLISVLIIIFPVLLDTAFALTGQLKYFIDLYVEQGLSYLYFPFVLLFVETLFIPYALRQIFKSSSQLK